MGQDIDQPGDAADDSSTSGKVRMAGPKPPSGSSPSSGRGRRVMKTRARCSWAISLFMGVLIVRRRPTVNRGQLFRARLCILAIPAVTRWRIERPGAFAEESQAGPRPAPGDRGTYLNLNQPIAPDHHSCQNGQVPGARISRGKIGKAVKIRRVPNAVRGIRPAQCPLAVKSREGVERRRTRARRPAWTG